MTEPDRLTPEPLTRSGETVGHSSLAPMSFVNLPEGAEFNLDWFWYCCRLREKKHTKKTGAGLPQVAQNDCCTCEYWGEKTKKESVS